MVADLKDFEDFFAPEPPDEALEPYVQEVDGLGHCLKHPLVYSVMHHPSLNKSVNGIYRQKIKQLAEALLECSWGRYVWLHERPYRYAALLDLVENSYLEGADYWRLVANIWTDSENLWQYEDLLPTLFQADQPDRHEMMETEERAALDALPSTVTIHRGYRPEGTKLGWSWTLDAGRARWFADRHGLGVPGSVAAGTVRRADVIALFLGRNESEIVVDPASVRIIK